MDDVMDVIKQLFSGLIASGKVKGSIGGPKDNVLVCDSMSDWCVAGGEID